AAEQVFAEGQQLMAEGTVASQRKAIEKFAEAATLWHAVSDKRREAIALSLIGKINDLLGEKPKALDYYNQTLALIRAVGDRLSEAATLNNIGLIYDSLGEKQEALDYYNSALPILQETHNTRVEAITLTNIGYVYDSLDERQKALDYYNRALPILRSVGDRRMEAITLNNIGLVHKALGDNQQSLDFFNQALELRRAVNDGPGEGLTLSDLGSLYAQVGEEQKALDLYQKSLQLSRAGEDKSTESSTLRRIALIELNHDQLEEARKNLEDALAIVEHLRTRIPGQELRASYFASVQEFLESYMDLLMRLHHDHPTKGYDALALKAAERARARSLLDSLTETRANIREGIAPALLERERTLQRTLDATAERQARLLNNNHREEEGASLKSETEKLLSNYHVRFEKPSAQSARIAQADADYVSAIASLSQMLLGPVAPQLGKKRLLIVGDGALNYLPFAALIEPTRKSPLIVEHEIVSLPS